MSSLVYYYTKVLLSRNYFHWSFIERAVLHQVSFTFCRCRCTPQYRHMVVKSGTTSGHLNIYSHASGHLDIWGWKCTPLDSHLQVKSTSTSGQLDIYIHASGQPDIWGCRCTLCRMQLRRQSMWQMSSWTLRNLRRLMCFVVVVVVTDECCCYCCSSVTVDQKLQHNDRWTTT